MKLAVLAQDLRRFELALLDASNTIVAHAESEDAPETYLLRIDAFLREQSVSLSDLTGLFVVVGPGSFTASRMSVTLLNTIGFTQHLPVTPLENSERLSLLELLSQTDLARIPSVPHVHPLYDRPPFITTPS